jgi:hypothetical protein
MGWILAPEYMQSDTRGLLWSRPVCQEINAIAYRDPEVDRASLVWKAPGRGDWMLGPILGRGGMCNGHTCGKILPAHVYRNEEKRRCGLLPGLVIFKLVAPPLQLGVLGPYLVQGIWFPGPMLLEGTGHIQNFGL